MPHVLRLCASPSTLIRAFGMSIHRNMGIIILCIHASIARAISSSGDQSFVIVNNCTGGQESLPRAAPAQAANARPSCDLPSLTPVPQGQSIQLTLPELIA